MTIDEAEHVIAQAVAQRLDKVVAVNDRIEGYKTFSCLKSFNKRVSVEVAFDFIEDNLDDLSLVVEMVCIYLSRQLIQRHQHG